VALAWRIEAFQRQKKLPRLESLLARRTKAQSVTEQKSMLHILSAQYGGTVRRIKRPRKAVN
jgi:hypothetical protein